MPTTVSIEETLRVIDGVLGSRPEAWLAEDVELRDANGSKPCNGRTAVGERLRQVHQRFADTFRDQVRLTVDEGRCAVEWVVQPHDGTPPESGVPLACVFDVEDGKVRAARLYYDRNGHEL